MYACRPRGLDVAVAANSSAQSLGRSSLTCLPCPLASAGSSAKLILALLPRPGKPHDSQLCSVAGHLFVFHRTSLDCSIDADFATLRAGSQPGQIASQVGSVRRVLFDLNYTVVEQLEALDDELFIMCAARSQP